MSSPVDGPRRMFSSLHTHSRYCDGHDEIDDYARAALRAGLAAYGASGHAPLPFDCDYAMPLASLDSYRTDVRRAADRYADRLPVFLGLELDYLPGLSQFYEREFLRRGFDYFVCSVHYIGGAGSDSWAYDESEDVFARQIAARHGGDARPVVEDYYRRICLMVEEVSNWGVPAFVGHLDRVTLWNRDDRYFSTDSRWYLDLVENALDSIQRAGLAVELNTSGWDKPAAAPNPGLPILGRCAELGIPSLLSADAHRAANVDRRFADGARILNEAGIREILLPDTTGWRRVALQGTFTDEVR